MTVYLEITLLPDVDISLNFLLQKVYQQLHLKLVDMQRENSLLSVQKRRFATYRRFVSQI